MATAKLQYLVGTFKGYNGTAAIYNALTPGGTEFLVIKSAITVGGVTTEELQFMSRSGLQSYMASGDATISSNVDISKLADSLPDGTLDADGYPIIDNADAVPRLYTGQAFYSVRGEGISAYTGTTGTPVSGGKDAGTTVVVNSTAKTISEQISEGVTWVGKNPILVAAIVLLLLEVFGITHITGLFDKKKKAVIRR